MTKVKNAYVWFNGRIVRSEDVSIAPSDRGFLYGDGVFETLRADRGTVHALDEHVRRLLHGASSISIEGLDGIDLAGAIHRVLDENELIDGTARVKIAVSRGTESGKGLPTTGTPTVLITAQKYEPPSESEYHCGWSVLLTDRFTPSHASIKSLSYLSYLSALQTGLDRGYDEVLLLDHEGFVAETSAGSILLYFGDNWVQPSSSNQLDGITRRRIVRILKDSGETVVERSVTPDELHHAITIWITNALLGVMPVRKLNSRSLPEMRQVRSSTIRTTLFDTF